jgi:hypothetical protein
VGAAASSAGCCQRQAGIKVSIQLLYIRSISTGVTCWLHVICLVLLVLAALGAYLWVLRPAVKAAASDRLCFVRFYSHACRCNMLVTCHAPELQYRLRRVTGWSQGAYTATVCFSLLCSRLALIIRPAVWVLQPAMQAASSDRLEARCVQLLCTVAICAVPSSYRSNACRMAQQLNMVP